MDLSERPRGSFLRHPWELARRELFAVILRECGALDGGGAMLDVGAGDAWLSRWLVSRAASRIALTCWDAAYGETGEREGVSFVRRRPRERFELVLMLDVLEHVDDDGAFLAETVSQNLVDEGHLLLSVPAWRGLFSDHDRALEHRRRYQPAECRDLIERCGLTVIRAGGAFHSLLLLRAAELAAWRVLGYKGQGHDELAWRRGELSRDIAAGLLTADARVSLVLERAGLDLPGLSWWSLCRKTSR
jgi:hypothetical protein